ncbi:hypothetical protein [Streptomyces canus]|uniref:hypothetical protein n=1 Tax=Streptomyces canus TaxID=58343 RepID=UPI0007472E11|nr:hypothetical protein [Streptomyces canus]KUN13563.1 hypothetical protein AQI96_09255 [Streptomyces canus]
MTTLPEAWYRAVLLQAASAVVDRVLGLTRASTRGGSQGGMFTDGFTSHGVWAAVVEAAVLAWSSVPALCAVRHRDAPRAVLPAGASGLVFAACRVLRGRSVVVLPGGVDTVWALVPCYLVTALALLLYRAGREPATLRLGVLT